MDGKNKKKLCQREVEKFFNFKNLHTCFFGYKLKKEEYLSSNMIWWDLRLKSLEWNIILLNFLCWYYNYYFCSKATSCRLSLLIFTFHDKNKEIYKLLVDIAYQMIRLLFTSKISYNPIQLYEQFNKSSQNMIYIQ